MKNLKRKYRSVDLGLLLIFVVLVGFGLMVVTSAAYPLGIKYYDDGFYYGKKQLVFCVLGFIAAYIISRFPRNIIKKISPLLFIASILLILALWTPLGYGTYGSTRWIKVPGINFRFQPSDILKITSVLFLAKILEINRTHMEKTEAFVIIVGIIGLSVVPIMIKDLSTGVVIGFSLFVMYVAGGIKSHQFVTLAGLGLLGMIPMTMKFLYRMKRIFGFLNPDIASLDENYQITQSLYAIAMGGIGGVGFFHSRQKYSNIPQAHNDFIFPVICEEFGLIGGIFVVLMFFLFVYRGYTIAIRSKNYYDKYVAIGITSYIGIQAIFNLGVGCGLFPVTGITLPLISYGGTSLLVTMASVGILLGISRDV
ncbi:MAG: putative peptidoglycan glycosyltransferase FtsW [Peptoniphilus sp.]|nr:putative peptidoglycan glycosyltransferase FtsW [Peptoniphilus sp.]